MLAEYIRACIVPFESVVADSTTASQGTGPEEGAQVLRPGALGFEVVCVNAKEMGKNCVLLMQTHTELICLLAPKRLKIGGV